MVTVENRTGRLIEVRQTARVTIEELQSSFPRFQQILSDKPSERFTMITDWRGMRILDAQTSQFLLGIMRAENDRIERHALIMSPSAVLGLQVRRLFSEAGGQTRMVFDSAAQAAEWLGPHLTVPEKQALRRFTSAGVAA